MKMFIAAFITLASVLAQAAPTTTTELYHCEDITDESLPMSLMVTLNINTRALISGTLTVDGTPHAITPADTQVNDIDEGEVTLETSILNLKGHTLTCGLTGARG